MTFAFIKKMNWDIVLMFAVLLICDTAAQVFFKVAADKTGQIPFYSIQALSTYLLNLVQNPQIIMGVIAIVIAFFTWLAVIAKIDLSKAHLITCLAYGTVPLSSMWLLHETASAKQLIGICLIITGAFIASKNEANS